MLMTLLAPGGTMAKRTGESSTKEHAMRSQGRLLAMLAILVAGCTSWENRTTTPGKQAPGAVAVGQAAPEIEGEDIDGKSFKLSDYRGKVVMLDFWGNW
jgi:cytochrome oxidase Cu insertion factor (SCO1/SenC/PrrC family)